MSSPSTAYAQNYHSPAHSYHSPANSNHQFAAQPAAQAQQKDASPLTLNTAVTFQNQQQAQLYGSATSQQDQQSLHQQSPPSSRSSPTDSATALPTTDEEWAKVADAVERRRVQNRNAQRKYRKKCKRRAEELERRKAAGVFTGLPNSDSASSTPINRSRYSTPTVGSGSRTSSVPALRHHESTGANSMQSMRSFTPAMDGQFSTFRHRSNSIAVMPTTELPSATGSDVLYPWLAGSHAFGSSTHIGMPDAGFSPDGNLMCADRASSAFPDMFPMSSLPPNTYMSDFSSPSHDGSSSRSPSAGHGRSNSLGSNHMVERAQSMPPEMTSGAAAANTGRTMLHLAAAKGNRAMLSMLLQKGGDPNSKDCFGYTPLHLAVEANHHDCADLLIDSGANIFATTEFAAAAAASAIPTAAAAASNWLSDAAAMGADGSGAMAVGGWSAPENSWAKTEVA